jgi:hypothetical protein
VLRNRQQKHTAKPLPASLKNEQSKNDRHNKTENKDRKSESSESPPKSQRFCIFIFSHRTLFKNNFSQPHKWHHSMTRKLTTYLKKKYKKMALLTQCLLLLFKNLLLIRTLKLKNVSLYDRVVIQDNEIEMLWNVKGCHKIKINGIGVFPGNSYGMKFLFSNRHNPIEITFYGIAKKLKKKIHIDNIKIDLLDKFVATTKIPIAIEVPYNREILVSQKQNLESKLSKDHLKMALQDISIEFEHFNIDNYKPTKTI